MIDYGEDKQIFGAPKIDVGPVTQLLTALYLGVFFFSFFMPGVSYSYLSQINADLPAKFWTLLTGIFVFSESTVRNAAAPSGFWVILTFMLIFLVVRPLERYAASKKKFVYFLLLFMLVPALAVWAMAPGAVYASDTWAFWLNGAAGWGAFKFRGAVIKINDEKKIPQYWGFMLVPAAAVITSICCGNWGRMALYLFCALAGAAWGVMEERKNNSEVSR